MRIIHPQSSDLVTDKQREKRVPKNETAKLCFSDPGGTRGDLSKEQNRGKNVILAGGTLLSVDVRRVPSKLFVSYPNILRVVHMIRSHPLEHAPRCMSPNLSSIQILLFKSPFDQTSNRIDPIGKTVHLYFFFRISLFFMLSCFRKNFESYLQELEGEWIVMVLDEKSSRLLGNMFTMSALLSYRIVLVENLQKVRQPLTEYPVVYFIEPVMENVTRCLADWSAGKKMYAKAHFIFLGRPSAEVHTALKSTPLDEHIASKREFGCYLRFRDPCVFDLDIQSDIEKCFLTDNWKTARCVAERLLSILELMKSRPQIRHQKSSNAELFASCLHQILPASTSISSGSASDIFLVLDRTHDICTPLMHDMSYASLLYDLMPRSDLMYTTNLEGRDGTFKQKSMILDENDAIWTKVRYMHIAQAIQYVHREFIALREQADALDKIETSPHEGRVHNNAIYTLPELRQRSDQISLHIDLLQKLSSILKEGPLEDVIALQQMLGTGIDESGNKVALGRQEEQMKKILRLENVSSELKLRLILLYTTVHGIEHSKLVKFVKIGHLGSSALHLIKNMGHVFPLEKRKSVLYSKKQDSIQELFIQRKSISRAQPAINDIVEKLASNTLSQSEYPSVSILENDILSRTTCQGLEDVHNVRRGDAGFIQERDNFTHKEAKSLQRLYIFVVGGITVSEMKCLNELRNKLDHEIYLGGTQLHTSRTFLHQLDNLAIS